MSKRVLVEDNVEPSIGSKHSGHVLKFYEQSHVYELDGKVVPGVTSLVKGGLPTSFFLTNWMIGKGAQYVVDWFKGWRESENDFPIEQQLKELVKASKTAYRKDASAAAGIGSLIHDFAYYTELGNTQRAEEILAAAKPEDLKKVMNGITKFKEWKAQNNDEIIATEATVASVKHKFAGKFDRLAKRDGRIVLSDFKTSSGIYGDMFVQLGAYAVAIKEWMDLDVEVVEILRFGKEKGEFEVKGFDKKTDIKRFKDQAIRCRETFEFVKKMEKCLG